MNQFNTEKSLSELFKEVQDIRCGRAKPKTINIPKENIKFNKVYVIDKKFNSIGAILGILFVIMFYLLIHSNYIFATSEEEKVAIAKYEQNDYPIEIFQIILVH